MTDVLAMLCTRNQGLVCVLMVYIMNNMQDNPIILADSVLSVWTGGFCCPEEKVAILACVVTGGYHPVARYQWYKDDQSLSIEYHPIMYAVQCGMYRCDINVQDADTKQFSFTVQGIVQILIQYHFQYYY